MGKVYGLLPIRANKGMLGVLQQVRNGLKIFYFDRNLEKIVAEKDIRIKRQTNIRFSTSFGNTLYLADMQRSNQIIWFSDPKGLVKIYDSSIKYKIIT